jgi:hypothetical protein
MKAVHLKRSKVFVLANKGPHHNDSKVLAAGSGILPPAVALQRNGNFSGCPEVEGNSILSSGVHRP